MFEVKKKSLDDQRDKRPLNSRGTQHRQLLKDPSIFVTARGSRPDTCFK